MAFDSLKACLLQAPILGFPTEEGCFILNTDASLFAVGGVLNQLQEDRESPVIPTPVLHYKAGNVSGSFHVYSPSLVSEGCAAYAVH